MLPPLSDPREAGGHTLPQSWGHHESHGALSPPWPHCPGATKCTYPGAALPANRGGLSPTAPLSPCGALWPLPRPRGQPRGGPAKGCPVSPPHLVLAPSLPCSDAPPQPWQRCTPSSRALPPTPGKTLHQMVLNPGPPPPHPRLFLLCTWGGTAGLPPKGLFIVAPPPPIHAPHKATSGPGPGGA